jgi:hypothetical protein
VPSAELKNYRKISVCPCKSVANSGVVGRVLNKQNLSCFLCALGMFFVFLCPLWFNFQNIRVIRAICCSLFLGMGVVFLRGLVPSWHKKIL